MGFGDRRWCLLPLQPVVLCPDDAMDGFTKCLRKKCGYTWTWAGKPSCFSCNCSFGAVPKPDIPPRPLGGVWAAPVAKGAPAEAAGPAKKRRRKRQAYGGEGAEDAAHPGGMVVEEECQIGESTSVPALQDELALMRKRRWRQ